MSNSKLLVEVMNASGTWVDVTADALGVNISKVGLSAPRSNHAANGRCDIVLNNVSQAYNPGSSALLDGRRRVRVRASGVSLGACLQAMQNGAAGSAYFSQVVSVSSAPGDNWTLQWDARAQFDSQFNIDNVFLVLSGETQSAQPFSYTNKWQTFTLTYINTASNTSVEPRFRAAFAGNGLNSTLIEYRNVSLKKNGGSNLLVNGNFASGAITPWQTSGSETLAVASDTWILFNGVIERIEPAPFIRAGDLTTTITCQDFSILLQYQTVDLPLQQNQTSDQLAETLAGLLPTGTLATTLPGAQFDAGRQIFQNAFDKYTRTRTVIRDALIDVCVSEFSRVWFDRDGTLRVANRDYIGKRLTTPVRLTLADGLPFAMTLASDMQTVINKVLITYTPRQTSGAVTALGQIQNYLTLPPKLPSGQPGSVTATLTYRDATGNVIGGTNVISPVAGTDYHVWDHSNGSGVQSDFVPTIASFQASASQATITFQNAQPITLYITFLQVRGQPVYSYDPITISQANAGSIATYQERAYTKDLPFSNDGNFASSLAGYYIDAYKQPFVEAQGVEADYEARLNGTDLLGIELMDVISVSDVQTGLNALKHMVTEVGYELDPAALDYVRKISFSLERLDERTYWNLGDPVYGLLDQTALVYI